MPFFSVFAGLSALSAVLLIAGIALLVAEMFHPGFGVMGGLGLAVLILDVIISAKSWLHGLILGGMLLLLLLALFLVFIWLCSTGKLPKKILLSSEQNRREGYVAADFNRFLNADGVAVSPLRPAGIMRVGSENLNVVSEGEFIEKGADIRVKKVEGNRLVVERAG